LLVRVEPEKLGLHFASPNARRISCIAEHVGYKADGRRPGRGLIDTRDGGFVAQLRKEANKNVLKCVGGGFGNQTVKAVAATLGGVVKPVERRKMFASGRWFQRRL
jgi:hypothetical protein